MKNSRAKFINLFLIISSAIVFLQPKFRWLKEGRIITGRVDTFLDKDAFLIEDKTTQLDLDLIEEKRDT